jgi:hypothetical protein
MKAHEYVDIALRCHVESMRQKNGRAPNVPTGIRRPWARPSMILVLDTETTTELTASMPGFKGPAWSAHAQSLLFGTARLYVHQRRAWRWTDEWLFHPDNLPAHGMSVLRQWVEGHTERVAGGIFLAGTRVHFHFCPLTAFLKDFYYVTAAGRALVCGQNLPFDLTRLAWQARPAHGTFFEGGFRLDLYSYIDKHGKQRRDPYRPGIRIKNLGGHKAAIEWTGVIPDEPKP